MKKSLLFRPLVLASWLTLSTTAAVAQETAVGDTSRWMQPDVDHWLSLPEATQPLAPSSPFAPEHGLALPALPELNAPEQLLHERTEARRLSDEALKRMMLSQTDLQLMGQVTRPRFTVDPKAYDYRRSGLLASWRTGYIGAAGDQQHLIGMMNMNRASFTATQQSGRWTFSATAGVGQYQFDRGTLRQLTVSASATYQFNENLSATLFGSYATRARFAGPATSAYLGSTQYGGYFTLKNEKLGIDLGVEQVFNPYTGRWETVPIVTPKVRITRGFTLELPVGYLIKEAISGPAIGKYPKGSGIIAPQLPTINPRFTMPPGGANNY